MSNFARMSHANVQGRQNHTERGLTVSQVGQFGQISQTLAIPSNTRTASQKGEPGHDLLGHRPGLGLTLDRGVLAVEQLPTSGSTRACVLPGACPPLQLALLFCTDAE